MAFDRLQYSTGTPSVGSVGLKNVSGLTSGFSGSISDNLSKSGLSTSTITAISNQSLNNLTNTSAADLDLSGGFSMAAAKKSFANRLGNKFSSSDPYEKTFNSIAGNQTAAADRHPADLGDEHILIEFLEYKRPSPITPANTNMLYQCMLPLPAKLEETFSVSLDPQNTGLLGAAVSQLESTGQELGQSFDTFKRMGFGGGSERSMSDLGNDSIGLLYQGAATAASGFNVAGMSGEQIAKTVGQKFGAIPNPHISVFFNGVEIRQKIPFSWTFAPRNANESENIKKIIKEFKKRILPPVSASAQNIMGYPQMVQLTVSPNNDGSLPVYKRGLIESINVEYTPKGPRLFKDNNPVFINFSFIFTELEVWTSNDFGGKGVDAVAALGQTLNNLKTLIPGG